MKKEIMDLIKSGDGSFRINNVSYLRRWTVDGLGHEVDRLVLEFDSINHVRFSITDHEIKSRDYDGIIEECKKLTEKFFEEVAHTLTKNLGAGYINTSKGV